MDGPFDLDTVADDCRSRCQTVSGLETVTQRSQHASEFLDSPASDRAQTGAHVANA
jgi:hypothetical protein